MVLLLLLQMSKRGGRVELCPKSTMCGIIIVHSRRRCRHRRIHTTTVARTEDCFVFFIQGGGGSDRLGVGVLVLVVAAAVALPTTGRSDDPFPIGTLILLDELLQHHRGILHLRRRRRRRLVGSDAQGRARGRTSIGALLLFHDRLVPFLLLLDQIGLHMRHILFHHPCETLTNIATRRATGGGASTIGRKKQLIQPYCPFE